MSERPLEAGLTAETMLTVTAADTASALGSGDVAVLATPRIVALCEAATVAALAGRLPGGSTSVGTRVECDHIASTHPGETVTARATLVEVDARRLQLTVTVADSAGRAVAVARVWRVVRRSRVRSTMVMVRTTVKRKPLLSILITAVIKQRPPPE